MRAIQVKWCENKKFSDDYIKNFMLQFGDNTIKRMYSNGKDMYLPDDECIDKYIDDDCFLNEFRNLYDKVEYSTEEKLKALPVMTMKKEVVVPSVLSDLVLRYAIQGKPFCPADADTCRDVHGNHVPVRGFNRFFHHLMNEIEENDFFNSGFMTGRKMKKENCCLATSYFLKSQPLIHYFSNASWLFSGYMHLNNLVSCDD